MLPQGLKVFRNGLAILVLLAVPAISNASELKQETLNAWDDYLRTTNLRMHRNLGTGHPFLWIDEESGRSQRVRQGEILISPAQEAGPRKVHDGLIHDWIGAIFIPSVRMNDVFAVLHDYNRYKDFYKPTVIESKLLGRTGELSVHPALAYGAPLVGAAMFGVAYLFWRSQIRHYQSSGH